MSATVDKLNRLNNNYGMSVAVRPAVESDIDWIVGELKEFSRFFGTRKELFGDETYIRKGLPVMFEKGVFLMAQRKDERMGFISGMLSPHMMNPKLTVLCETFWWVAEAHRRSRAGLMLLEKFIEWGKEHADWVMMYSTAKTELNEKSLRKRGFRLIERSFILEVA